LTGLFRQDMVPAALTRDKKKINEVEIEVSVAWKSTLYVTNFPEDSDDASIRELFGKVSLLRVSCPATPKG
jgi:RNA recognition motif-containing protein